MGAGFGGFGGVIMGCHHGMPRPHIMMRGIPDDGESMMLE